MDGLRSRVRRHPVVAYVVVAIAISWTAWGFQFVQSDPMGTVGTLCFLVGGFGPLLAALVVARLSGTGDTFLARLTRWRTSPGWYFVAILGPVVLLSGTVLLTQLASTGELSSDGVRPLATLPGLVVSGILLGGLEEPGWRGFAQEHLQRRHSAFVASLIVGVVWITWHIPLFVIPGTAQSSTPVLPFAVMGLGLAVVFAWAYNSAGRSLPVVIVLHGAFNGALGWSGLIETGTGGEAMWIVAGAVGLIALGVLVYSGPVTLSSGAGSVADMSEDRSEVLR